MTVETQINRVQYVGNSLATDFPVPFPVLRPEHLRLFLWANDIQTELTSDFTVLGAGTSAVNVRLAAALPSGVTLTILRQLPLVQPMDLRNGGNFNATTLEGSADNLAMQIQQIAEAVNRAVVAPESVSENIQYTDLLAIKTQTLAAMKTAQDAADLAGIFRSGARDAANTATEILEEIRTRQGAVTDLDSFNFG